MSHIANDIVADNKLENMPWLFTPTFEVERSDEMEQEIAEVDLEAWGAEEEMFNDRTN